MTLGRKEVLFWTTRTLNYTWKLPVISQINVTNVLQLIRTMEITQEITEEIRDKR